MEGDKRKLVIPILVMVMLVFSSLMILGGGVRSVGIKANFTAGYRQILFIYDNTTLAGECKDYLNSIGYYMVNFLPYNMLRNVNYYNYGLIIIGTDSHTLSAVDLKNMMRSQISILGVGYGGIYAYLNMGYSGYTSAYYTDMLSVEKNLSMYTTPYKISGVPGDLTLFDTTTGHIYVGDKSTLNNNQSLCMGFYYHSPRYASIIQIKNFLLFGYTQSPVNLTEDGEKVLGDLIHYIHYYYGMNIHISKAPYKLNVDGAPTVKEWSAAQKVYLSDGHNFVAMLEDPDYLYLWCHSTNSTHTNDFVDVWFERDNNRTVGVDKSVFYIVFLEYYGLAYREANGYNSWGSFERFDGVNLDGETKYTSSYMDAEIRISKKFLGIKPGSNNIMGFGVMYQYNGVMGTYPQTFSWEYAQTAATVYSEYNWNGELNYLNSKRWISPVIDGNFNFPEWNGASTYSLNMYNTGDFYSISVCHDKSYLYIGGYMPNVTNSNSQIYLYFDTNGDGGTAPHTDDFEIWGGKSSTGIFSVSEHYGTGSGWGASQSLTNANMKFSMKGTSVDFELRMSFSKLGITSGANKEIRMQIALNIDGNVNRIPIDAQHTVPDTWALILYSQSLWDTDQMTLDAREDAPVNIDGDLSEWDDSAFFCTYPTPMGKDITVFVKTYEQHLVIGLWYQKPYDSGNTNFQLGFDVGDNGGSPENRDFVIMIYHDTGTREFRGNSGTGWWDEVTPSGWTYAMDNSSVSGWTVEISINYDKLGITPGVSSQIGFILYMDEDSAGYSYSPVVSTFTDLSTWNTITSSDNWEEAVIPEFGTFGIIFLSVAFAAIVILKKRKT